jgi:hypothetical protein
MADPKPTTTVKKYPEEAKAKLTALLEETKEARECLDNLDKLIRETASPTGETLKLWSRQATGWGNYLRKKFAKLSSACINEKGNRYIEIKLECNDLGIVFADGAAKQESEAFIGPLRSVRDIFEAYVLSAESIVSTSRMHFYGDQREAQQVEV